MTEGQQDEIEREDLEQARKILEIHHADAVRSSFESEDDMASLVERAEGLEIALDILEQVETGEWNSELADELLEERTDAGETELESLRDLSQHIRNGNRPSEHTVVNRVVVDREARGYWGVLKDIFGFGDRR